MTAPAPRAAARRYRRQQKLVAVGLAQAKHTWAARSFRALAAVMSILQYEAAVAAVLGDEEMLEEQGVDAPPGYELVPEAFSGRTAAGGDLESFLEAAASLEQLEMAIITEINDAARTAAGTDIVSRPAVEGHIRYLNPPSCSRCTVLAGRFYKWSDGFLRHPNCFPAGVVVSGPPALATTRRWYEGELVVIRTASGKNLPVTANHPVLTDQGWVPANLLDVGDHVVDSTRDEGASPLVVPDEQQRPALIEDLWRPSGMMPLRHVPTSAEDFHGDGGHGDVDVVFADRLLGDWLQPSLNQGLVQNPLAQRAEDAAILAGLGSLQQLGLGSLDAADGIMGGRGAGLALLSGRAAGTHLGSSRVRARFDAPALEFLGDGQAVYARVGLDLQRRLSGQVSLDRIVHLDRVYVAEHVYNLTSSEGWLSANGIIASNCDCFMVPVSAGVNPEEHWTDPMEAFRRGDISDLTEAEARAITDGADISQVINVRRKAAGLREAGLVLDRLGRLTPEGIYKIASDRDEALKLLRKFGYLK